MFAYCNNAPANTADADGGRPYNVDMTDGPGHDPLNPYPLRSCKSGVSYNSSERIVIDISVSFGLGINFKIGVSFILDPIGGKNETYFHVGASGGPSLSLFGVSGSASLGAGIAWDYNDYNSYHGWFFDYSGSVLFGADFCHGINNPLGENTKAALSTFSTACSASLGIDYYCKPEDILHIFDGAVSDILDILPIIAPLFKSN